MKEGASIILHLDCLSAVDCLTDEQAGILFKGLLRYANMESLSIRQTLHYKPFLRFSVPK